MPIGLPGMNARKPYPFDVFNEEWALVAPYLPLRSEVAGQREHPLREVSNSLGYITEAVGLAAALWPHAWLGPVQRRARDGGGAAFTCAVSGRPMSFSASAWCCTSPRRVRANSSGRSASASCACWSPLVAAD